MKISDIIGHHSHRQGLGVLLRPLQDLIISYFRAFKALAITSTYKWILPCFGNTIMKLSREFCNIILYNRKYTFILRHSVFLSLPVSNVFITSGAVIAQQECLT